MTHHDDHKAKLATLWSRLDGALPIAPARLSDVFDNNLNWRGMDPVGELNGIEEFMEGFWLPLRHAFTDFTRQTHILMAGQSNGRVDGTGTEGDWVAATGYFTGRMSGNFLNIPASNSLVRVRWGEFARFEQGRICYVQYMIDLIDWCEQIGIPLLPKSRGVPFVYPAPTATLGVDHPPPAPDETERTLKLGRELIFGGLNVFDEEDLASMGMRRFFHPNLKWYGPGGINACLSLTEFEDFHQQPWLTAFPDRKVQNLESLFADGPFLAGSGISGVHMTHTGTYLGYRPSNKSLEVNGLDFWLRTGNQFTENWVFVDMVGLFRQMGYDIFTPDQSH